MARSGKKPSTPPRELSPQVEVPGSVIHRLIMLSAAEPCPAQAQLKKVAKEIKNKKLVCDLDTAVLLLEYSKGQFKTCKENNCNDTLVLKEAIGGLVSCLDHRQEFKVDSRMSRGKKKIAEQGDEAPQVRSKFIITVFGY